MGETSTKPYLIRALHEWCTDNGYTPYIVVQVDEHTMVPMGHVQDGQITLNVGTLATNSLLLGNEYIEFQARFGGVTENVAVHVGAVSAIYARETGAGMGFEVQPYEGGSPSYEAGSPVDAARETPVEGVSTESRPTLTVASDSEDDGQAAPGAAEPAKSDGDAENKRPHLTIVK